MAYVKQVVRSKMLIVVYPWCQSRQLRPTTWHSHLYIHCSALLSLHSGPPSSSCTYTVCTLPRLACIRAPVMPLSGFTCRNRICLQGSNCQGVNVEFLLSQHLWIQQGLGLHGRQDHRVFIVMMHVDRLAKYE
jgi:hypothetical protein